MSDEPLYYTCCGYEMGGEHEDGCVGQSELHDGPFCEVDGVNHRERGEWCRFDYKTGDDITGLREYTGPGAQ